MTETIVKALFDVLYNTINVFLQVIFSPIIYLTEELLGNIVLNDYITNFYGVLNTYIIPGVSWFTNLVPPMTWNLIILYFTFMIGLYSIALVSHYVVKPLHVIKKLIPFS